MTEPGAETAYRAAAARDAHEPAILDPAVAERLDHARRGIAGESGSACDTDVVDQGDDDRCEGPRTG